MLAAGALLASGDAAAQAVLLPAIASGETIATLAVPEDDGSWAPDEFRVTARRSGDRYLLDGRKSFVLDGMTADLILVAASSDDGPALFAVDGDALGLSRQAMQTLDMTRKQAMLTFSGTPGRLVGRPGAAAEVVAQAVRGGVLALAAEQVGGAQRCLDMAVAYAKVRHQFGRAIGSFQAIKHICADMLLEVESARSAAYYAAWAAADGAADLPLVASLAKAYCSGPTSTSPRRTSRFTEASASPGNMMRTCTTGGPSPLRSCWAHRPRTVRSSPACCSRTPRVNRAAA